MARTTSRRVTRLDREQASRSAASSDIGPVVRGLAIVATLGLLVYLASVFAPADGGFGGPLQGGVTGSSSLTSIRKTGGGEVTLVVSVPWNAGIANAVLEELTPIEAYGVEVKRSAVVVPGGVALESQRGFPPPGATLLPLDGYTIAPGVGDLDGFQVVVGLSGEGSVAGFVLRYRVGDTGYAALLPAGALLCAEACSDRTEAEQAQREAISGFAAFVEAPER